MFDFLEEGFDVRHFGLGAGTAMGVTGTAGTGRGFTAGAGTIIGAGVSTFGGSAGAVAAGFAGSTIVGALVIFTFRLIATGHSMMIPFESI